MGAVHEHGLGGFSGQKLFLEELEEAVFGEPVEVLMHRLPQSEFRGQRPPRAAVSQDIPERVEVTLESGNSPSGMDNVVAS